jgi:hypothetical protein
MANHIEGRFPLADDLPLLEFMFSLPASYKIHGGWTKVLLRKHLERFGIDKTIVWRKQKQGYTTPQSNWLDSVKNKLTIDWHPFFVELFQIKIRNKDIFNSDGVSNAVFFKLLSLNEWFHHQDLMRKA